MMHPATAILAAAAKKRRAQQEVMMVEKPKVGSKVRLTGYRGVPDGTIGEITKVMPHDGIESWVISYGDRPIYPDPNPRPPPTWRDRLNGWLRDVRFALLMRIEDARRDLSVDLRHLTRMIDPDCW